MKPKYLELSPEDLVKVQSRKRRDQKVKVSPEELFIAEFGYYYGWEGMVAIAGNKISMEDANILLNGAKKVWNSKVVDLATAMQTAFTAAQSGKKAKAIMNKGLKEFIKQSKADL